MSSLLTSWIHCCANKSNTVFSFLSKSCANRFISLSFSTSYSTSVASCNNKSWPMVSYSFGFWRNGVLEWVTFRDSLSLIAQGVSKSYPFQNSMSPNSKAMRRHWSTFIVARGNWRGIWHGKRERHETICATLGEKWEDRVGFVGATAYPWREERWRQRLTTTSLPHLALKEEQASNFYRLGKTTQSPNGVHGALL